MGYWVHLLRGVALAVAAYSGTPLVAHSDTTSPPVLARMDSMITQRDRTRELAAMLKDTPKGAAAHDTAQFADVLNALLVEVVRTPALFTQQVHDPTSDARDRIWRDWERFTAHNAALEAEVRAALTDVHDAVALAKRLERMSAQCAACHKTFRK